MLVLIFGVTWGTAGAGETRGATQARMWQPHLHLLEVLVVETGHCVVETCV